MSDDEIKRLRELEESRKQELAWKREQAEQERIRREQAEQAKRIKEEEERIVEGGGTDSTRP